MMAPKLTAIILVVMSSILNVTSETNQAPLNHSTNDSRVQGVVIKTVTVTVLMPDENGNLALPPDAAEKFKLATEASESKGESHVDSLVRAAKALSSSEYEVVVLKNQNGKTSSAEADLSKQHPDYAQARRNAPIAPDTTAQGSESSVEPFNSSNSNSEDEFVSTPPMAHGEDWIFEKPSEMDSNLAATDAQQNRSMRATVLSSDGGGPGPSGSEKLYSSTRYCGFSPKVDPSRLSNISPGQFPWAAAILSPENKFLCSGTLISNSMVVTTASCVIRYRNVMRNNQPMKVVLGVWSLPEGHEFFPEVEIFVSAAAIHPSFNTNDIESSVSIANNVALLRLLRDVDFDIYPHIFPICIIGPNLAAQASTARCQVLGWPDLPEMETWRTRAYLGAGETHITPQGCPGSPHGSLCIQGQACFGNEGSAVQCLADSNRYYQLGMLVQEPNCNRGSSITISSVNIINHYNFLSDFIWTKNPNPQITIPSVPSNQQTNSFRP